MLGFIHQMRFNYNVKKIILLCEQLVFCIVAVFTLPTVEYYIKKSNLRHLLGQSSLFSLFILQIMKLVCVPFHIKNKLTNLNLKTKVAEQQSR